MHDSVPHGNSNSVHNLGFGLQLRCALPSLWLLASDPFKSIGSGPLNRTSSLTKKTLLLQRLYEEFKVRINALVAKAQNRPRDGWTMADGSPWPGNKRADHESMIQVSENPTHKPPFSGSLLDRMFCCFGAFSLDCSHALAWMLKSFWVC